MIELPEARVLAGQLNQTVQGKRITAATAAHTPHGFAFYHGDPGAYPALLNGKRIGLSKAYGGRVEIEIEDMRLSLFDGVNLRRLEPGQDRPQKHQLLIELDDGSALYCTVQMYGGMMAYPAGESLGFYGDVAREKPSPLTEAFDRAYFDRLFEDIKPLLSAKALLATEQRIPGLGNGTLQDILFRAGIHPKAKAQSLGEARRARLFDSVKNTLQEMADKGGRDTEKDLFGHPGGYKTALSAKTLSAPCPQCMGPITRQAYMGGNIYFCHHCQAL